MKMAARALLRRAAGMEHVGALGARQASQFEFLERRGGHHGNLRPMRDREWSQAARLADFAVSRILLELQRKQFQSERAKVLPGRGISNELAQTRGEVGQARCHAVLWITFRLVFRYSRT